MTIGDPRPKSCPLPSPGDLVAEPTGRLRFALRAALNDKKSSDEIACLLQAFADQFNSEQQNKTLQISTGAQSFVAGQPVHVDSAGMLSPSGFLSPVTAVVNGLVLADAAAFSTACIVTSGQYSLDDWTDVTGQPDLIVGAQYFLTSAGDLTDSPPAPGAGQYNTRVGYAISARALVVDPRDTWQLF